MAGGESQNPVSLSDRELQITDLVAAGLTNQEIAAKLECPPCAHHVRTAPVCPANPLRARELGHTVAMGLSYHTTPT